MNESKFIASAINEFEVEFIDKINELTVFEMREFDFSLFEANRIELQIK